MKPNVEKLEIDKLKFESLRTNPRFISILHFARVLNALMFCLQSYNDYKDSDSPVANRQKFRSLFIMMGFLHEGFVLLEKLETQFSGENFFDNTLGRMTNDIKIKNFRDNDLVKIRNANSFHFGDKVVPQTLKKLDLNEYILISFESPSFMDMYFPLADELDFNFWTKDTKNHKEETEKITEILSTSLNITVKFIKAAEKFMSDAYQQIA